MTHECDDTAYPAAAMPGECTCPPEQASVRGGLRSYPHLRVSPPEEEQ